eukprot:710215-Prymnesium_polylepis.1
MASGGADSAFAFNPTSTPHWSYVSDLLVEVGIPEISLRPGLPALHTVHEVLMCREHVQVGAGPARRISHGRARKPTQPRPHQPLSLHLARTFLAPSLHRPAHRPAH